MTLNKEEIIKAKDIKIETVEVPEWGGTVNIKSLSVGDRDEFTQWVIDNDGKTNTKDFMAKMVALALVDDEGNRLFTKDELSELSKKSINVVERLYKIVSINSGLSGASFDEAKENLKN